MLVRPERELATPAHHHEQTVSGGRDPSHGQAVVADARDGEGVPLLEPQGRLGSAKLEQRLVEREDAPVRRLLPLVPP
jgi:hypothetical protein